MGARGCRPPRAFANLRLNRNQKHPTYGVTTGAGLLQVGLDQSSQVPSLDHFGNRVVLGTDDDYGIILDEELMRFDLRNLLADLRRERLQADAVRDRGTNR